MKIFGLGVPELLIILAVALLIFGPKNLPKLGSALGKTVKNLRDGMEGAPEIELEDEEAEPEPEPEPEPKKKRRKKAQIEEPKQEEPATEDVTFEDDEEEA